MTAGVTGFCRFARGSIIGFCVILSCSSPSGPQVFIDPHRYQGLPSIPDALLALSDQHLQEASSPRQIEHALAALELALQKAPPSPFEALWRLARACFFMADRLENREQWLRYARQGRHYAEQALLRNAGRVEPHYYLALNMAKVAEATHALRLIKPMMAEAEIAVKIDRTYDNAGALRFMGKVYITAPAWPVSIGSPEKAVELLEQAVSISPVPLNRLFLGEAYYHDEHYEKAEEQLHRALKEAKGKKLDKRWLQEAEDYLRRLSTALRK